MDTNEIRQVLISPISLFRRATKDESGFFSDKKEGWIYVVGLASGQRFFAHMQSELRRDENNVFTLRPQENSLPGLKEVQWIESPFIEGHGVKTTCVFLQGVSDSEKQTYIDVFSAHKAAKHILSQQETMDVWEDHPIFKRLSMTQQLRRAYEANRNAIRFLKKEMLSLEIPEKVVKNQGTKQLAQQKKIIERKKVNG